MEAFEFGTLENSVSILVNDVWGSPDWVDWYEDSLEIKIHQKLHLEIGLTGLGGSAAYLQRKGHTQLFPGAPMYQMSASLHKDLTFVVQLALDIFYLLEQIRRDEEVVQDATLSSDILQAIGPLVIFLKTTLETRPDLIQQDWWNNVMDGLKVAGVRSITLNGEKLSLS